MFLSQNKCPCLECFLKDGVVEEMIKATSTLKEDDNGSFVVNSLDPLNYFFKIFIFFHLVVVVDPFVLSNSER